MKYTILSAKQVEDHIFTEVKYDFDDGTSATVSIPHFQPQSKDDVLLGITNRLMSENKKNDAAKVNATVLSTLDVGVAVTVVK